jgi:hypothetical protein
LILINKTANVSHRRVAGEQRNTVIPSRRPSAEKGQRGRQVRIIPFDKGFWPILPAHEATAEGFTGVVRRVSAPQRSLTTLNNN